MDVARQKHVHQDAAVAVDDGLGQASRSGRIEYPQRMVERELGDLHRRIDSNRRLPVQDGHSCGGRWFGNQQRDVNHGLQAGQRLG
ncbi:hypothetical protein SDC9_210534 [bioreactor metagenome]|uniref:Uncharacterized protein n=1 Tax=bioreactor metagenome TaxID=1076179 RepID=A0A645JGP1_9ZZZZ